MKLDIYKPFSYKVASTQIDYDFTELRKDKRTVGVCRENLNDHTKYTEQEFVEKYFRILEDYPDLKKLILDAFHVFSSEIHPNKKFAMSTSWIAEVLDGGNFSSHNHTNCVYSAVLYHDTYDENSAVLHLRNPIMIGNELSCVNEDEAHLRPYTGGLYFFPAQMMHYTSKQKGEPRYSLACNFVLTDPIYNFDSSFDPSWLNL